LAGVRWHDGRDLPVRHQGNPRDDCFDRTEGVGGEEHGLPAGDDGPKDVGDRTPRMQVGAGERVVQDEDSWPADHCLRQRHPGESLPGQRARQDMRTRSEAGEIERITNGISAFSRWNTGQHRVILHALAHGKTPVRSSARCDTRQSRTSAVVVRAASEPGDLAGVRSHESSETEQERGLARPDRTEDAYRLAARDVEIDTTERVHARRAPRDPDVIALGEPARGDRDCRGYRCAITRAAPRAAGPRGNGWRLCAMFHGPSP
jgi:hypothetical protein